jgi:glycosyltransferase involved in cell wall biosynthesis
MDGPINIMYGGLSLLAHDRTVAVLIPTLWRPNKMRENVDNLHAVTGREDIDIVFIIEEDDEDSLNASKNLNAITLINKRKRNFAGAINTAVQSLDHNYIFGASDDFLFHPNWLPPLMELSENYGVVGANDLGNSINNGGIPSVSYLVRRDYVPRACIGYPENLLYEGYHHNFTDTELSDCADAHGEHVFCAESIVEHMHPSLGKSIIDRTYMLSFNHEQYYEDNELFMSRRPLWGRSDAYWPE